MKTKSIISANIDTDLVKQLKGKTKGTRSRTIERALRKYLDDQDSFALEDVPTLKLIMELAFRKELPDSAKQYLRSLYNEVKES
jgi:metal-responsive CopG/Arc/MetJ family transcriptional regulator